MINPAVKYRRRSIRLKGYDYSISGAYFVTICTWQRECLFGELVDGTMQVNELGRIVDEAWLGLSVRYPEISLDAHVIMPNHLHGILMLSEDVRIGCGTHGSVGAIHELPLQAPGVPVWQRNYYERIIRDDLECSAIRQYIAANPTIWIEDENHPAIRSAVHHRGNS